MRTSGEVRRTRSMAWARESVASAKTRSGEPPSRVRTPSAVTGWVSQTETLLMGEKCGPFIVDVLISVKLVIYSLFFYLSSVGNGVYLVLEVSSSGSITLLVVGRANASHVMIAFSRFTSLERIPKWSVRRHAQK